MAMPPSRNLVKQVCRSSWQVPWTSPARSRAALKISMIPSVESAYPRLGPLSETKSRSVGASGGRSLFM